MKPLFLVIPFTFWVRLMGKREIEKNNGKKNRAMKIKTMMSRSFLFTWITCIYALGLVRLMYLIAMYINGLFPQMNAIQTYAAIGIILATYGLGIFVLIKFYTAFIEKPITLHKQPSR